MDWDSAMKYCQSRFGNRRLVIIRNQQEQDDLTSFLKSTPIRGQLYVALYVTFINYFFNECNTSNYDQSQASASTAQILRFAIETRDFYYYIASLALL